MVLRRIVQVLRSSPPIALLACVNWTLQVSVPNEQPVAASSPGLHPPISDSYMSCYNHSASRICLLSFEIYYPMRRYPCAICIEAKAKNHVMHMTAGVPDVDMAERGPLHSTDDISTPTSSMLQGCRTVPEDTFCFYLLYLLFSCGRRCPYFSFYELLMVRSRRARKERGACC